MAAQVPQILLISTVTDGYNLQEGSKLYSECTWWCSRLVRVCSRVAPPSVNRDES